MGEARRKRERQAAVLQACPVCIFCGGVRPAQSVDHQPPKVFFHNKRHPEGCEYAACDPCNHDFGPSEQVAALWIRFSDNGELLDRREFGKILRGVYNNNRACLPVELPPGRAVWRNAAKKIGINLPEAASFSQYPIVRIPSEAKQAIAMTGAKIAVALNYKHTKRIFPCGGRIDVRFDANIRHVWPERARPILDLTSNVGVSSFQRENLSSQFAYRWAASDELGAFVAILQYGSAFLLYCILVDGSHKDLTNAFLDSQAWSGPSSYRF